MSTPVEFSVEQYAVMQAAVEEAYKKGKATAGSPSNSFVNCHVTIEQGAYKGEPIGSSAAPTPDRLEAPGPLMAMEIEVAKQMLAFIKVENRPMESLPRDVLAERVAQAYTDFSIAAKGDTSLDRIRTATVNLITHVFATALRNGAWEVVSG